MKKEEFLNLTTNEKEYFMLREEIMQNLKYSQHIEIGAIASTFDVDLSDVYKVKFYN